MACAGPEANSPCTCRGRWTANRRGFSRMKRYLYVLCLLFLCAASPALADLSSDVETILQDKALRRTSVGVEVVRLGSSALGSKELVNFESHAPLIPASNLKLITTSAALDQFGSDFKFHTAL